MKTKVDSNSAWTHVNWKKVKKSVFNLQRKIFQYSKLNNLKKVHQYQILLINSFKSKLLAIRHVTQDNRGKKTARVDGIKSISSKLRWKLAQDLELDNTVMPIRRIYIPRKDGKLRPLGIPTLTDRVKQKLVLLGIEPQWEAKFDINSYGFRPGRSCQDAIEAVHISINRKPKYVLNADIEKCFDRISHKPLLEKLEVHPKLKTQIHKWLKAGVMESDPFNTSETLIKETLEGTPQGGVISPLLANIALDGIEKELKDKVIKKYGARVCKSLTIIRYADDLVIVHPELEVIKYSINELNIFLAKLNLSLSKEKSKIVHTLNFDSITQTRGFEFLGFHIRQLPIGKYKRKKQNRPYRTLTLPSRRSVSRHIQNLKLILKRTVKNEVMISRLNPMIIGWANYFRFGVSSKIFNYLDHKLFQMIFLRLEQIHRTRSKSWIYKRYFERINKYKWTFCYRSSDGNKALTLARHAKVKILRHVKVKGDFSIYDENLAYWVQKLNKMPNISSSVFKLLKKQKSKCALFLMSFDMVMRWKLIIFCQYLKEVKK